VKHQGQRALPVRLTVTSGTGYRPTLGFQARLEAIGGRSGNFHDNIWSAICSYISTNGIEGTDPDELERIIRERILTAPRGDKPEADIGRGGTQRYRRETLGGAVVPLWALVTPASQVGAAAASAAA
jgi:hypothetical protein